MRMDASGLEPGFAGQPAEDEESAGAGERAALCVQEELGAPAAVEVRAPAGEVAPDGVGGLTPERNDALLVSLAETADESVFEVDAAAVERDGLADAKPGAVQELDQRAVAERARRHALSGFDQALD